MILCLDWAQIGATSAPCDVGYIYSIWGISWAGTFKMVHSPIWRLGRVDQKAGLSWNMQRSKSQLLCFSSILLHGNSGPPKEQKGKLPHLFKAWAQHCHFCYILSVKHLLLHLSHMTGSCGLCQNVHFLTSGPSDEMGLLLMLYNQTAEQISHPTRQPQNILLQGLPSRKTTPRSNGRRI